MSLYDFRCELETKVQLSSFLVQILLIPILFLVHPYCQFSLFTQKIASLIQNNSLRCTCFSTQQTNCIRNVHGHVCSILECDIVLRERNNNISGISLYYDLYNIITLQGEPHFIFKNKDNSFNVQFAYISDSVVLTCHCHFIQEEVCLGYKLTHLNGNIIGLNIFVFENIDRYKDNTHT